MQECAVYLIGPAAGVGPLKIGTARDPMRRLRALQTGAGKPLALKFAEYLPEALAKAAEGHAHWLLDASCTHGEWFSSTATDATNAIRQGIAAAKSGAAERAQGKVGRPKINDEQTPARFVAGTLARIDAACADGEKRSDFIRQAVEAELSRRERKRS